MPISLHVALDASVAIEVVDVPSLDDLIKELEAITRTDVQMIFGRDGDPDLLLLDRERIEIAVAESHLSITREYPSEENIPPLAAMATAVLAFLDQPIKAMGYNVDLVFEQNSGRSAERYLGSRLFKRRDLGGEEWPIFGGSGTMIFGSSQKRKSFRMAPRLEDDKTTRVLVEANYHVGDGRTPTEAEINESLTTLWADTIRAMELVDMEDNS